jgi:TP901 family phage tail tape measure protein
VADRSVSVWLKANVAGFVAGTRTAARAAREFGGELDKAAKKDKLDEVHRAALVAGGGLLALAGYAVKAAAEFDAGMSRVSAATHASARDLDALRAAALQAGKDTQYSATEAADAVTELAKAGVSTADILGGGLKGALALAAAGSMDVGEAAETAATALTQFKLSGAEVPHVADLLAAAAGKAQGEVHDMGYALKQSGLVAAQFGVSIEETTGTLAAFASAGLIGSDAGTSFKQMLLQLANPSGKSAKLMRELGIAAYDTSGRFVGIKDLAGQLQNKLTGLTQAQRDAALAQIFGSDAIRAANVLYKQGAAGIGDWTDKVNDAGYATETARLKTDNLKGDLERLRGSLETVAIQAGSGTSSGLRVLTRSVEGLVDGFGSLPSTVQSSIVVLAGVSGSALLLGSGFLKAKQTTHELLESLSGMGVVGDKASKGLGKMMAVAGKAGAIGAGFLIAYGGLKALGEWVNHQSVPVARGIDGMTQSLKQFAAQGQVGGELAKAFGGDLRGLGQDLVALAKYQDATRGITDSYRRSIESGDIGTKETMQLQKLFQASRQGASDIQSLDKALAGMAGAGSAGAASVAMERLARGAGLTDEQITQLKARMPEFNTAMQGAALANTGLAQGFGDAATNAKTLVSGLELAINSGKSMIDIWNQLNGAVAGSDDAMLKALESVDAVKKSFEENGKSLDRNTVAGLRNRVAIEAATQAAAKAAQKKYEETGSVEAANAAYEAGIAPLRDVLKQYGFAPAKIQAVLDELGKMPEFKATAITLPGADKAQVTLRTLDEQIKSLKDRQVKISQAGAPDAEAQISRLQKQIDSLRDRKLLIEAQVYLNASILNHQIAQAQRNALQFGPNRWGGVYEHAATGLLREAATYPAANPGRYMIAEPATGGEAFVPRRGSYGRSMSILSRAAGWYGARIVPGGGGGGTEVVAPVVLQLDGRTVWESQLRFKRRSNKTTLGL